MASSYSRIQKIKNERMNWTEMEGGHVQFKVFFQLKYMRRWSFFSIRKIQIYVCKLYMKKAECIEMHKCIVLQEVPWMSNFGRCLKAFSTCLRVLLTLLQIWYVLLDKTKLWTDDLRHTICFRLLIECIQYLPLSNICRLLKVHVRALLLLQQQQLFYLLPVGFWF